MGSGILGVKNLTFPITYVFLVFIEITPQTPYNNRYDMQETEIQENQENRTPPKSLSLQLEDLEGEEWKDIEGFSKYKISNYGRFRHIGSQRIKTWNWNKKRFPRVSLHSSDGKCRPFLVKELTSAYFLENPEQFTNTICKDGDKLNNSIDNLVWDGFSVTKDGFRKCKRCLCKKSLNN